MTDLIRLSRAVFAAGDPRAKPKQCARPAATFCLGWVLLLAGAFVPPSPAAPESAPTTPVVHRHRLDPIGERPGFRLQSAAETGIHFINRVATSRHLTNQIVLNGSGVAAGDVDGDGWCDLYFCGVDGPNALYRNLGEWRFVDFTASAGVACAELDATGAALADLDGDRDLDLLVNTIRQGTHVFFNDGAGHFQEARAESGLNVGRAGMSLAVADIDGDGDLDVYVANYRAETIRDQPNTRFKFATIDGHPRLASVDGRPASHPEIADRFVFRFGTRPDGSGTFRYEENGEPDLLLRNDGTGRLTPVPFTGGTFQDRAGRPLSAPPLDWGLSAMFRDLTGDGAPDLYVCNDFQSPDRIWINDGQGRFRPCDPLAFRQAPLSSMGVDVADVNRDGFDDLFVADMLSPVHERRMSQRMETKPELLAVGAIENCPQYPRNMLYVNRGDGTWAETAQLSGVDATDWTWTPIFLDVDLDGYEDLLVTNGFERDGMNADVVTEIERLKRTPGLSSREQLQLRSRFPRLATANLAFRNLGNLRFADASAAWGFNLAAVSQGMALADLDNDGDLDVAINNFNGPAAVYRNEGGAPRVEVRLHGTAPNTRGIGARITVLGGAVPRQSQEMICGGRYLSSDEPVRTFAAGSLTNRLTIEVSWRSGARSVVRDVQPNESIEIEEPARIVRGNPTGSAGDPIAIRVESPSHFVEPSGWSHRHHENGFDDYAIQPALPHRLSQLGPGVCWFDFDGDGWDDLFIGAGLGGSLGAFRNDRQGGFQPLGGPPWTEVIARDITGLVGCRRPDGRAVLIAGSSNHEDGSPAGGVVRIYDPSGGRAQDEFPGSYASTGPVALADYSGDGQLDLFVGGRAIPGRFPEAAPSLLFRGEFNRFTPDPGGSAALSAAGLVSGAVFADLDGDGRTELVLACSWGPLRVYRFEGGRCLDQTRRLGLERFTGLWNGVTAGDFDGDGRLDLAASNWGRNSRYERFRAGGLRLVHGVSGPDGSVSVLDAYEDPASQQMLPLQPFHVVATMMPSMRERLPDYTRYARASVPDLFGEAWPRMEELRVEWLESTVFLNRGDRFEPVVLPDEAQWAPAFAINAADLDGDGHEDLFLSQNLFAVSPEMSRLDAGRSLWLRGDGDGRFTTVPAGESGLRVYGEQRGAAFSDFDHDGRVDLVVSQNGAATRLYRNVGAKPGLRIRLKGLAGNPDAIGAVIRIGRNGHLGPAREVHAGSGYWSQDSAVPVLSAPGGRPQQLWVRWPGGRTNVVDVPAGAREITVSQRE